MAYKILFPPSMGQPERALRKINPSKLETFCTGVNSDNAMMFETVSEAQDMEAILHGFLYGRKDAFIVNAETNERIL